MINRNSNQIMYDGLPVRRFALSTDWKSVVRACAPRMLTFAYMVTLFSFVTDQVRADDNPTQLNQSVRDAAWFKQADQDGDGRLSREEAPNKAVFDNVDTDGDGFASVKELQVWMSKRPQRAAQPTPGRREQNAPAAAQLGGVEKRPVVIFSDGTRMAGDLYLPKDRQVADGRDHNHTGYTTWMAGGGVKGGFQYGATDEFGYEAVADKVHIHDWHATILHLLGLDHERLTFRHAGRDMRLTDVKGRVHEGMFG